MGKWIKEVPYHACLVPNDREVRKSKVGSGSIYQCDCGKRYRLEINEFWGPRWIWEIKGDVPDGLA